ncbi:MAG: hypothetical protein KJ915_12190 [Candidatus Omnitrophica bacterium]|nr:hypothetical protein [Candidatus Omnitrophota bacterium]
MASLNMDGPYLLIPDKIDEVVPFRTPGAFALGYISDVDFVVIYIGRSDVNLNNELKDWVFRKSDCLFFKYSVTKNAQEAFQKECTAYHDFGGINLKSEKHPERMAEMDWRCPVCDIY